MKVNILSDLHVGFSAHDTPLNDADLAILAGDIAPPRQAAQWAMRLTKPVVYVLGNHELYGSSIEAATGELKRLCAGTQVHVLDNDEVVIDDVRFLGTTLWTDFLLFGAGARRTQVARSQPRYAACWSNGGHHPSRAVATEHPPEICRVATECLLCLRRRAPRRGRSRAVLDPWTHARQF